MADFRPLLALILDETPDLVFLVCDPWVAASLLRQTRAVGMTVPFLGGSMLDSTYLVEAAGDSAEGLVVVASSTSPPKSLTEAQRRFVESFERSYGESPDWAAACGHDVALVILEAIRSGARSGEEIRAAVAAQGVLHGATGIIRFDERGDIEWTFEMRTVRGGGFVDVGSTH